MQDKFRPESVAKLGAQQTRLKWFRGNSIHRMSIDKLNIRTVGSASHCGGLKTLDCPVIGPKSHVVLLPAPLYDRGGASPLGEEMLKIIFSG